LGPAAFLTAAALMSFTPHQKAALVVVAGLPAPRAAANVLVQRWNRRLPRPRGAFVFADQEGGAIRAFSDLPPRSAAHALTNGAGAYAAGLAAARALRRVRVDVDLAPVLDLPDGPLGARQFRSWRFGIAFARGLVGGGEGACAKHFPGLGPLPVSTDEQLSVRGKLRERDLAPYRAAVEEEIPCVMVGHGIYRGLGRRRASLDPAAYRLLRSLGFEGVAITDSLGVLGSRYAPLWAVEAVRAGADLVLFTSGRDAARAIHALVPLAQRGELDEHVARVLRFRAER
jgi:beta-N-acetylhexosaminidase